MIFFVVFFSIGVASFAISILCDDLVQYYRGRNDLAVRQHALEKMKSINTDLDILLEKLEKDPNHQAQRLAPATLGTEHEDANAVYPRATPEQLDKAHKVLMQDTDNQSAAPMLPNWLTRCSEPRRRITLFISGSFLILISFICFTPKKQSKVKQM